MKGGGRAQIRGGAGWGRSEPVDDVGVWGVRRGEE